MFLRGKTRVPGKGLSAKMVEAEKIRAQRNRTITLEGGEASDYKSKLLCLHTPAVVSSIENATINQNLFEAMQWLPSAFVDLLFIDPPYNLTKTFDTTTFRQSSLEEYMVWVESWLSPLLKTLKPTASVYICSDWRSSTAIHLAASKYLNVRNRITWEREKGRGAKTNWKNCTEDIWFCTKSDEYTFNVDAVKLKRRVIAPYKDLQGKPKDWEASEEGDYRLTAPSNVWTDLTVPFWSMPENTDHPTQKPEKLLAKILLASSNTGDFVFDPFLGSGTTSVVASKLGRRYAGVEQETMYCCLAEKRLALARQEKSIQGYQNGVFWERNSLSANERGKEKSEHKQPKTSLFD